MKLKKSSERHGIAPFAAKNYWLFPKILSALGIESSWESQSYSKKFFTELYRNVACKFPNFVHLKMKIKLKWISRVKCDEFIPKWNRIKLKCIYILFHFILLAQLRGAAIKTRKNFTLYVKGGGVWGVVIKIWCVNLKKSFLVSQFFKPRSTWN